MTLVDACRLAEGSSPDPPRKRRGLDGRSGRGLHPPQLSGSVLSILEHKYSNVLIYSFLTMEISSISVVALLLSREIVTSSLVSNTMS